MDKRTGRRKSIEQDELREDGEYREGTIEELGLEEMNGGQGMEDGTDSSMEE